MSQVTLYSRMWRAGTGQYVQGLARGLTAAGLSLTFIAPHGEPDDAGQATPAPRRIRPPREYREADKASKLRRAARSLHRIMSGLGSLMLERRRSRNIIVSIPEPLLFWLPALLLLRLSGAQVIFICHDPEPHAWRLPRQLQPIERGAHALNYALASHIVVLSKSARTELTRVFAVASERISVIPHGAFEMASQGAIPGRRTLLVFGTIRRNKQVHLAMQGMIAARRRGIDAHLHVAGGIDVNDPDYLTLCEDLAATSNGVVTIEPGYITDARLTELMRDADAMLLPYADFQSQSGVAVMAGMAARPVICTRAGGLPDLIETGLAAVEIASPAGAAEIADAIAQFFNVAPDVWTDRAHVGRERLAQALEWTRIGTQFRQVLA